MKFLSGIVCPEYCFHKEWKNSMNLSVFSGKTTADSNKNKERNSWNLKTLRTSMDEEKEVDQTTTRKSIITSFKPIADNDTKKYEEHKSIDSNSEGMLRPNSIRISLKLHLYFG